MPPEHSTLRVWQEIPGQTGDLITVANSSDELTRLRNDCPTDPGSVEVSPGSWREVDPTSANRAVSEA